MSEPRTFEPSRHLTLVNGNEYLEVKWRLVWLRTEHPDAMIETELVTHQNGEAVFRAQVSLPHNGASATGWGSEDSQGFGDYIEKAETKAIGRALAAIGFGTQFCNDHDFGSGSGRVVDSPVRTRPAESGGSEPSGGLEATARQMNLVKALARELRINEQALDELARQQTGKSFAEQTRKSASAIIEHLKDQQGQGPTR